MPSATCAIYRVVPNEKLHRRDTSARDTSYALLLLINRFVEFDRLIFFITAFRFGKDLATMGFLVIRYNLEIKSIGNYWKIREKKSLKFS